MSTQSRISRRFKALKDEEASIGLVVLQVVRRIQT